MTAHPVRARPRRPSLVPQLVSPYVGNWSVVANSIGPRLQRLDMIGQRPMLTVTGDDRLPKMLRSEMTAADTATGRVSLQDWLAFGVGLTGSPTVAARFSATHVMRTTLPLLPATTYPDSRFTYQRIVDGAYDVIWTDLGNRLRINWPNGAIVAPGWEINANWYPWAFRATQHDYPGAPAAYRAAFRHIVGIVRPLAPRVKFEWNIAGLSVHPNPATLDAYWPGDDVVDLIGYQIYAESWRNTETLMRSGITANRDQWAIGWNWALNFALGRGYPASLRSGKKPLFIGEWGVWTADNPFHMEAFFDWMREAHRQGVLVGHSYFDVYEHLLDSRPLSLAVYRRRVAETTWGQARFDF